MPEKRQLNWSSPTLTPSCTAGSIPPALCWTRAQPSPVPVIGLFRRQTCLRRSTSLKRARGRKASLDPGQRMPREAMLFAYTRNSARAMNQQDSIGSLAPSMQADMVARVLDVLKVSPEERKDTKVQLR